MRLETGAEWEQHRPLNSAPRSVTYAPRCGFAALSHALSCREYGKNSMALAAQTKSKAGCSPLNYSRKSQAISNARRTKDAARQHSLRDTVPLFRDRQNDMPAGFNWTCIVSLDRQIGRAHV